MCSSARVACSQTHQLRRASRAPAVALMVGEPARAEVERRPMGVKQRLSSSARSASSRTRRRDVVDQVPSDARTPSPSRAPSCSSSDRSSQRRNDSIRDGLTANRSARVGDRPVVRQRSEPPPLVRVGTRHPGGSQPGQLGGGVRPLRLVPVRVADRRRAARRRARVDACPGRVWRAAARRQTGSSSSRKRDGCSSSPRHGGHEQRRRARVTAT